ncbi:hypothetical protein I6A60_35815 [Frankia sp. AgB1.9]|uniref:hypothetical protein n=1 Tax=unclassified Frankia TaxID=2632575 RepID=UPI001931451D|nr:MULTISPECIES: hypothetical protein [unclassified Frankia]MBL7486729.1 hypothetical protein [Frankia sp. AgW1.1]MBL7553181.1 hypothetical protein [Frankia sp. AgB1.9]MBL7621676.1 hypothetical protein [Frankia sp. AgB1.8]
MAETGRSGSRRAETVCFLVVFIALQSVVILFLEDGDSLWQDFLGAFIVAVIARTVTWLAFGRRRRARP